jgi:hypothetical protein
MKAYLNASEISKLLKVNRATVTRWAKKGVFRGAIQVKGTHQWRIPLSAYEEVVKQKQIQKKMKVVSFSIFKGGTGKTTSTVSTAAALVNRPKTSEATARGNIVSTDCFLDVLALASLRSSVVCGAMAPNGMVRYIAENETWRYRSISA